MRVLLFANRVVEPIRSMTGIGRYVHHLTLELARAGAERGYDYDLAGPAETGRPAWLPPQVSYRRMPGPRRLVHTAWTALGTPRLERLVGPFDLVHALHPSYPIPTGRPAVITIHDLMPSQRPEWYEWDEIWGFRRTLEQAATQRWTVIVDSRYVAEQIRGLGLIADDRLCVVPLAVGREFYRRVAPDRILAVTSRFDVNPGGYLLAVGNVSTRKNLVTLVRAFARADLPGLPLVLAGRAHTSAREVDGEIEGLDLHDRVRLAGFVRDEDLPGLVQGALALVHPSVDEGFGLPPLEAMAAGTPVVAANAGSLPEIVSDAGLLVAAHDVDGWAEAFQRVASSSDLRDVLRRAGRSRAAQFGWDRTAEETLAVHRRVLETA